MRDALSQNRLLLRIQAELVPSLAESVDGIAHRIDVP